jgi:hypothetical protein
MDQPLVTCLQLSYGRPHLSVEAVESFLLQSYPNKKLIIVNTHKSPVWFENDFKNIEVYNVSPFPYLSDVYRFGLSLIQSPYFCIWDDDDIFLPWHIADRVQARLAHPECNAITHEVAFCSQQNVITDLGGNMFVSQYLYDNNGIKPDASLSCWDVNWDQKPWKRHYLKKSEARPSYIYRWATGEGHISSSADEAGQHQNYLRNIEEKNKLDFPAPWIPTWTRDYVADAMEYMGLPSSRFGHERLQRGVIK